MSAGQVGVRRAQLELALAAMELAQDFGWPVFPCQSQGKAPLLSKSEGGSGCLGATTHTEQVGDWWEQHPNANIGIATGGRARLFVVDVDGADGENALQSFAPLPETVEATTGKGRHLYFRYSSESAPNTVGQLGPHIDTRGSGGYVIAPPSVHPTGARYSWQAGRSPHDRPLAELPRSIADRWRRPVQTHKPPAPTFRDSHRADREALIHFRNWLAKVPCGLRDGDGRNAVAFRIATRALETLSQDETDAVLRAWNSGNAQPLQSRELQRVLASAVQHASKRAA